jgi:Tfp pilus assembly protein PilN
VVTKLNLATYPFRNRALPYLLAGLMILFAAIGGIYSLSRLNANRKENDALVAKNQEKQTEISRLKGEGEKVQQLLTPDQKTLLVAAHKLVANKRFGWSRLFADLEAVLPSNVSASRIAVQNIYDDAGRMKAELEVGVISKDYPGVEALIENMNNSGMFRAELRGQDLQKNERITYTEYTFHVIYTPAYGYSTGPTIDIARNQGGVQ